MKLFVRIFILLLIFFMLYLMIGCANKKVAEKSHLEDLQYGNESMYNK